MTINKKQFQFAFICFLRCFPFVPFSDGVVFGDEFAEEFFFEGELDELLVTDEDELLIAPFSLASFGVFPFCSLVSADLPL